MRVSGYTGYSASFNDFFACLEIVVDEHGIDTKID